MVTDNVTWRSPGAILHAALSYDVMLWLATRGRERVLRERLLELAQVQQGEAVLDVGCGTGTVAILAKRYVGAMGRVCGIDASPEMIARAKVKAENCDIDVRFQNASAQALPFPEASFDVTLSTLMLHHLGRNGRVDLAREMCRVLRPAGRALIVDFATPTRKRTGILKHFRHGHGGVALNKIVGLVESAGFEPIASGAVGAMGLHYVLAAKPRFL